MSKKFYPTPSTTKCYVNDIELDDIFRVDFKRNKNHQPIYGYNDEQFGFVAKGKELVSGQIVINFRYPGYLTAVLKNAYLIKDVLNESKAQFDTATAPKASAIIDELDKLAFDGMTSAEKAAYVGNILAGRRTANDIADLKNQLKNEYIGDLSSTEASRNLNDEASGVRSPLDFDTSKLTFDLVIKYGFQDDESMYRRIFKDCILVGESSTVSAAAGVGNDMSSSAQGILEVYPFFARTIEIE
mgnify:CR=1 FL=1